MSLRKCLLVMSDPIITILKTLPHKVESTVDKSEVTLAYING
jgi:hypothetical protein